MLKTMRFAGLEMMVIAKEIYGEKYLDRL